MAREGLSEGCNLSRDPKDVGTFMMLTSERSAPQAEGELANNLCKCPKVEMILTCVLSVLLPL